MAFLSSLLLFLRSDLGHHGAFRGSWCSCLWLMGEWRLLLHILLLMCFAFLADLCRDRRVVVDL
jgi:hypothetical protein